MPYNEKGLDEISEGKREVKEFNNVPWILDLFGPKRMVFSAGASCGWRREVRSN